VFFLITAILAAARAGTGSSVALTAVRTHSITNSIDIRPFLKALNLDLGMDVFLNAETNESGLIYEIYLD